MLAAAEGVEQAMLHQGATLATLGGLALVALPGGWLCKLAFLLTMRCVAVLPKLCGGTPAECWLPEFSL